MANTIVLSDQAELQLKALESDPSQAIPHKAVRATLGKMEANLYHPGLKTHVFKGVDCPHGRKLFEAYAQNKTPGAYRIFWCYCGKRGEIYIVSIVEHP